MFRGRSHTMDPLTKLLAGKKGPIQWSPACQQAFDTIKSILAQDAFLRYPDHNKPFHIYCDASDLQLGAAILQDDAPVAYYSRKLTPAQRNYTVGEKELLSVVETLKEYRTMLYGCKDIQIYTDHKNNTFQRLNTQRVIRWRLFIEEYGPTFHYIKGHTNTLADALSRLSKAETLVDSQLSLPRNTFSRSTPPLAIDDDSLLDCFVNLPSSEGIPFELTYPIIAAAQQRDALLMQAAEAEPRRYANQLLAPDIYVLCFIPDPESANPHWKIYLPTELLTNAVKWYHLALGHVGKSRLYDTIALHFYHPTLRLKVEDIVLQCDTCQRYKQPGRGYGENCS
jgi:hypothetical protein